MSEALAQIGAMKVPSSETLNKAAVAALEVAKTVSIVDDASYTIAGDELREIKGKVKALRERQSTILDPLKKAADEVRKLFGEALGLLEQAEGVIKARMVDYATARERGAAAARREAEEAAKRAAEEAASSGNADNVVDILEASVSVAVAPQAPKAAGISKVRTTVKARVVDKRAFIAHASSDQSGMLLEMIEVSESKLSALMRATGGSLNIPGVETFEEKSISARAA